MHEHHSKHDLDRLNRPPTLSEYATAKKEFLTDENPDCGNPNCKDCYQIRVDKAEGESESVALVVDRETVLDLYWISIPKHEKRKIKIGDSHDRTKFPSK